jgi:uncharacterized protein YbdZ (MbtH family)
MGRNVFSLPMQRSKSAVFGIIMSSEKQCTVWPANESPPEGWRFTSAKGTREAMQSRVDQQFVPTAPALPIDLDRRYGDAEWAAAEFDE